MVCISLIIVSSVDFVTHVECVSHSLTLTSVKCPWFSLTVMLFLLCFSTLVDSPLVSPVVVHVVLNHFSLWWLYVSCFVGLMARGFPSKCVGRWIIIEFAHIKEDTKCEVTATIFQKETVPNI